MKQKSSLRRYLSVAVLIISISAFSLYVAKNSADFKPLLHVSTVYLCLLVIANLGSLLLNGLFIKAILVPFNKFIGIVESFYVSLISSVGNYFAPVGVGLGFRAVYLKRRHGLSYSDFMATLAGNYILVFLVVSLAGLFGLGLLHEHASHAYWTLFAVFSMVLIFDLMLMSVSIARFVISQLEKIKFARFFVKILLSIVEGWILIIGDKRLLARLCGLIVTGFALLLAMIYIIITSLHLHIAFGGLLLMAALSSLSVFINITPGNIGIKEAVFIFSSQTIGLSTSQVLSYSVIDRGVLFLVLSVGWIFLHVRRNLISDLSEDINRTKVQV